MQSAWLLLDSILFSNNFLLGPKVTGAFFLAKMHNFHILSICFFLLIFIINQTNSDLYQANKEQTMVTKPQLEYGADLNFTLPDCLTHHL